MKGKKRQGSTLPMVIVTIVLLVAMIGILASIVDTGQVQTQRMYSYLKAKYVATSGSQLALGAYFENEGTSPLLAEFSRRAQGQSQTTTPVTSTHTFKDGGTADIEMNGAFDQGSRDSENYNITIKSKSKLPGSEDYYEHVVIFNWATRGIRSEQGHLVSVQKQK
ncbi:hypothetical protein ACVRXQ_05885 [Streptococcus panodentis]|uniref:Type 4 fimbrial biogenesis protein PilX N-terminal domain-containing protein n=1 Tax=Streptococcus panodentis TaxID=1581472 RepID=A0ABS5AVJ4_9STRE|nr:hypothetical protein [Streptococcus panodentis]MBP2620306.1 hypothetical protein [Streptococcus panodentis]